MARTGKQAQELHRDLARRPPVSSLTWQSDSPSVERIWSGGQGTGVLSTHRSCVTGSLSLSLFLFINRGNRSSAGLQSSTVQMSAMRSWKRRLDGIESINWVFSSAVRCERASERTVSRSEGV